jgi:pilus assembly protein CpaF
MELVSSRKNNFAITDEFNELKKKVHDRLVEVLDLSLIDSLEARILRQEIRKLTERILSEDSIGIPLNSEERERFYQEIQDEVLGLGPIEPFMHDDSHLRKIIDRIVSAVGRRIDESSPMVDARLADGSRVNAIVPPVAIDGPSLSIRRFSVDPLELEDLINLSTLVPEIGELLKGIVRSKLNVIVSGGTGSGKTTLLNVISRFIPEDERIVTIEDAAELQLKQDHVVRLETRPQNIEGKGEITQRELVRNSLRMRPDRIIVGEVRGPEVLDMLQAMNTGHDGSLTTIHANAPRDALIRLETLVAMTGLNIPNDAVRRYISSAINIIIHVERLVDGSRKIVDFQELTGMEGNIITTQEIFTFEQKGIDKRGRVKGQFKMSGILPRFTERFKAMGIPVPYDIFNSNKMFEV